MQKIEIQAHPRTTVGRQVKSLRTTGLVPAVLYGNNFEPRNIQVSLKDFQRVYGQAGESTLVYVSLDGQSYPTIIHDVAADPLHDTVLHADFYKVRLDEKIKTDIPVVIVGEAPAVKNFGGILVQNINQIEVEGFPQDLPHNIEVDVAKLMNLGDQVQIKDLTIASNLEVHANPEDIIALVQAPISEEELKASLEATTGGVEDVEVIEKEKKEEEVIDDTAPSEPVDTKKE